MRAFFSIFACLTALAALPFGVGPVREARAVAPLGPEFDGVDVKNKLGEKVDVNIPFTDSTGKTVTLGDYLDGTVAGAPSPAKGRPVVFTLNFYRCTSICSRQLNALVTSLKAAGWAPGPEKFRIVTVSFDPSDTVEIAAGKQKTYREELVRQLAEANGDDLTQAEIAKRAESIDWTFLVAREKSVRAILDNVGYTVKYDERTQQYAHSPVTYILTPSGLIGRYLWGIDISPRDLKFSLMESSEGELGSFGEKILLSCFDYNREHGGYEAFAWGFMRIGGLLVALIFGAWLFFNWRRDARRSRAALAVSSGPRAPPAIISFGVETMIAFSLIAEASGKGFWMPEAASDFAEHVDSLFIFILVLSTFFFALLMGLTGYFAVKYRATATHTRSSAVSHNFKLEFLWSAIPTVLMIVIFAWGFRDFTALSAAPADALQVRVVAQKWNWTISYPQLDRECTSQALEGGEALVDFYLQVNRPFTVQMSSNDVLHSFWIPAFRVKRDVLPNRYTGFTVTPTKTGIYPLFCAEYCGDNHSQMHGSVHVMSEEDFQKNFVDTDKCKLDPKAPDYKPKLFAKFGCNSCHGTKTEQGIIVGPNLHGKFGTMENTSIGQVKIDEDYIRQSVEEPQKVLVDGFGGKSMPSFKGRITEAQLAALIDYIKSLK